MYQDHENAEFAFFMRKVNNLIVRLTGLSVDDFADACWFDLFEDTEGKPTRDDIIETLADADCIFAAMMQEQAA